MLEERDEEVDTNANGVVEGNMEVPYLILNLSKGNLFSVWKEGGTILWHV